MLTVSPSGGTVKWSVAIIIDYSNTTLPLAKEQGEHTLDGESKKTSNGNKTDEHYLRKYGHTTY